MRKNHDQTSNIDRKRGKTARRQTLERRAARAVKHAVQGRDQIERRKGER
jgi:hypothetical protein